MWQSLFKREKTGISVWIVWKIRDGLEHREEPTVLKAKDVASETWEHFTGLILFDIYIFEQLKKQKCENEN